ncbi:hypothetical protein HNR60_000839 [Rhodopseudomonas rhenobacensis]|uniref:DUF2971 domain-containing protein n=2 Tax=Rhodopseudomonas rhenobacensis TaxID=87461 RepID=A0A7W8DXU1_9BRAD|nr:hypothetical protein [Rhodopseudomonas rhenobacensis]
MLNAPEPSQLLYKIMRPEDLIRSMAFGYLHFNRVDCYRDFKDADLHDGEQLPGDVRGNTATKFEKAEHFSAADYYVRSRSRTYACCFSLDNSEHIWREYADGSANGKIGLEFEFGKLRARLNETLHPDKCMLQADGKPCIQIFSVNYGMVDYVDWETYRANTEHLPNPIRYTYLKDACYAPERELRVSLSALGMGEFAFADGSTMAFSDSLQAQFDFRSAFADGTIKQILIAPGSNLDFLRVEFGKLGIAAIEGPCVRDGDPAPCALRRTT